MIVDAQQQQQQQQQPSKMGGVCVVMFPGGGRETRRVRTLIVIVFVRCVPLCALILGERVGRDRF